MRLWKLAILLLLCRFARAQKSSKTLCLPDDWLFGASSAAPQVEGAWDEDGKGVSAWDHFTHQHPEAIKDGSNGDIASDFYHHYEEDIKRVREMGMNTFRFSLAWTRIMPNGHTNNINKKGIDHYHRVIDTCLKNKIIPMVNIEYWDIPQTLVDIGGWTNEYIIKYFLDYCDLVFKEYGDKVKWWLTFNEPTMMGRGYDANSTGRGFAPNVSESGIGPYLVGHTVLKAHAAAYHLYDEKYRPKQKGKISLILEAVWFEPKDPNHEGDVLAAQRAREFYIGWFANPIFGKGDYPQVMKDRIEELSKEEGFRRSRLPKFTKDEVEYIKGTADFLAFNEYTMNLVTNGERGPNPSCERDAGVILITPPEWPGSDSSPWLKMTPTAIRKTIKWFWDTYLKENGIPIIITENGFIDGKEIADVDRCKYLGTYIYETLKAVYDDGVKVIGYLAWSLLDSFEWSSGYSSVAGLYQVDTNDPGRKRTPRQSSKMMSYIANSRCIPQDYVELAKELQEIEFENPRDSYA